MHLNLQIPFRSGFSRELQIIWSIPSNMWVIGLRRSSLHWQWISFGTALCEKAALNISKHMYRRELPNLLASWARVYFIKWRNLQLLSPETINSLFWYLFYYERELVDCYGAYASLFVMLSRGSIISTTPKIMSNAHGPIKRTTVELKRCSVKLWEHWLTPSGHPLKYREKRKYKEFV